MSTPRARPRDNAKKILDSRQQLFKQGALPGRLVDESQVAFTQAVGQYRAAEEHLKALQSVSKEEQIKGAAAQVQSRQSASRFARGPGRLFPHHEPDIGHRRRPAALMLEKWPIPAPR